MISRAALLIATLFVLTVYSKEARFTAKLSGSQVVPPATLSAHSGTGVFIYDYDDQELRWEIEHTVREAEKGYLMGSAPAGENGKDKIEKLDDPEDTPITGSVDLDDDEEESLFKGELYVIIMTEANPDGEIRGQITRARSTLEAELDGDSQEPKKVKTNATGTAVFKYNHDDKTLEYTIQHTVQNPTGAHIHGPAGKSKTADVLVAFPGNSQSPISGTLDAITDEQEKILFDGKAYINIHSTEHPDGEIRGQVEVVEGSSGVTSEESTIFETCATGSCGSAKGKSNGIGTGGIVAIILGVAVGLALIIIGAALFVRWRANRGKFQRVTANDDGAYVPPVIGDNQL